MLGVTPETRSIAQQFCGDFELSFTRMPFWVFANLVRFAFQHDVLALSRNGLLKNAELLIARKRSVAAMAKETVNWRHSVKKGGEQIHRSLVVCL